MSKNYELNKVSNGWELKRGAYAIYIDRLSSEVLVGPHFKKEQCGVVFSYVDLSKDSPDPAVTLALNVVDPDLENIEQSLITLTKKMLVQVELGTFGKIEYFSDPRMEFLQYILRYLGEDSNTYLHKETRIPINMDGDKLWSIRTGIGHYQATRSKGQDDRYHTTTVTCELIQSGEELKTDPRTRKRTVTFTSQFAEPLSFEKVKSLFM